MYVGHRPHPTNRVGLSIFSFSFSLSLVSYISQGNLGQLTHRDGWAFQKELANKYGSVARLYGPLGVIRSIAKICVCPLTSTTPCQGKMLFVYDPLALHHIVVKDQHIFEEPMSAIQYVTSSPAQHASFWCLIQISWNLKRQHDYFRPRIIVYLG